MNIACLGWGSLIWDPRGLPIQRYWFHDGPLLPIEFARHSSQDRITLVLVPSARHVRALWIPMIVDDLNTAKRALAEREGMGDQSAARNIGYWNPAESSNGPSADVVATWASRFGLDGVVWTALPPRFQQTERVPSAEEVLSFLRFLPEESLGPAEEYVRRTPPQIDTEYRRRIEAEFHWTPKGDR